MLLDPLLTGTGILYHLLHLRKNQWKSLQDLRWIQRRRLKTTIQHAYDYVPYYHQLFKSAGIKPYNIKDFDDLKKIPITTKTEIHSNLSNMLVKGVDPSKHNISYTSGSTGIPAKIVKDQKTYYYSRALMAYAVMECGVGLRDKFVKIGRFHSFDYTPNQISIPSPTESQDLALTASLLRRIRPDAIYTMPSVITNLCTVDTSGIEPKLIFTNGSTLTQHTRHLAKSTFGIDINDTYGSVEFNRLAFECNEHAGMHMITDCAIMEFLNEGEQVSPGETGEIVVTGLSNRAMPLIRYALGDLGVPSDETCSCGRKWPLLKRIEGRTRDILTLESGRRIYPAFLYRCLREELLIREHPFCVSQFQFVQEKRNKLVLKVVRGSQFDIKVLNRIKQNIDAHFAKIGEEVTSEIRVIKEIPIESSGKRKTIVSLGE